MLGCAKKNREIHLRRCAFKQKKKRPGLKFNPGLVSMGLQTSGPWGLDRQERVYDKGNFFVLHCHQAEIAVWVWLM